MVREAAGGFIAVANAQFPPRPIAIGINRGFGHAQLPGDLFGAQVAVDETQAFTLPWREAFNGIVDRDLRAAHKANTLTTRVRRRLAVTVPLHVVSA